MFGDDKNHKIRYGRLLIDRILFSLLLTNVYEPLFNIKQWLRGGKTRTQAIKITMTCSKFLPLLGAYFTRIFLNRAGICDRVIAV